jgi:hypothetical protein
LEVTSANRAELRAKKAIEGCTKATAGVARRMVKAAAIFMVSKRWLLMAKQKFLVAPTSNHQKRKIQIGDVFVLYGT